MTAPERTPSSELLTDEGRRALGDRPGVADVLESNRWLATAVTGVIGGGLTAAGLLLGGVSIGWSLTAGAVLAVVVVCLFALASVVLRRPVIPALWAGENEPGQLLEGETWTSEHEAAREARRRNLSGGRGGYWIEVEIEPGTWAIERRGDRVTPEYGEGGGGGWFGDGGSGGGGDGGGGGG
jgi:hypothetical protein